jgi:hypothetical protein
MGIGRSIPVVVVGVLMMNFIDRILGTALLQAVAGGPIRDQAAYLAVFDKPLVPAVVVVTHGLAALLSGYVMGKLAGTHEVQHAAVAAGLAVLASLAAPAAPNMLVPPTWVRVAMIAITPPGMLAGAYVRGQARVARGSP